MVHSSKSSGVRGERRNKGKGSSCDTDAENPVMKKSKPSTKGVKKSNYVPCSIDKILAEKRAKNQQKYGHPLNYRNMRVEVPSNFKLHSSKKHHGDKFSYPGNRSRQHDDDDDDEDYLPRFSESEESEHGTDSEEDGSETEHDYYSSLGYGNEAAPLAEDVGDELDNLTLAEQSQQASGSQNAKKKRGMSKLKEIHDRSQEEIETITLNADNQPIGDRKKVGRFSRFLGTVAHMSKFAPIHFPDWRKVPQECKDELWEYVLQSYDVPEEGKDWVMKTVCAARTRFKSRTKAKLYKSGGTIEERLAKRPKTIPPDHCNEWLNYLEKDEVKEMCRKNKENRKNNKFPHRVGPVLYSVMRDEMTQASEEKVEPSDSEFFLRTRKPNGKPLDEETAKKVDELEELQRSGDKAEVEAKLNEGMGKEHSGFVLFRGRGVTKTALKHRSVGKETMRAQLEQEKELWKAEIRQEVRQEYNEQLRSGLKMTASLFQQHNPTFVIPPNMFDFLLRVLTMMMVVVLHTMFLYLLVLQTHQQVRGM